jgi:hypothetical protein
MNPEYHQKFGLVETRQMLAYAIRFLTTVFCGNFENKFRKNEENKDQRPASHDPSR